MTSWALLLKIEESRYIGESLSTPLHSKKDMCKRKKRNELKPQDPNNNNLLLHFPAFHLAS